MFCPRATMMTSQINGRVCVYCQCRGHSHRSVTQISHRSVTGASLQLRNYLPVELWIRIISDCWRCSFSIETRAHCNFFLFNCSGYRYTCWLNYLLASYLQRMFRILNAMQMFCTCSHSFTHRSIVHITAALCRIFACLFLHISLSYCRCCCSCVFSPAQVASPAVVKCVFSSVVSLYQFLCTYQWAWL